MLDTPDRLGVVTAASQGDTDQQERESQHADWLVCVNYASTELHGDSFELSEPGENFEGMNDIRENWNFRIRSA